MSTKWEQIRQDREFNHIKLQGDSEKNVFLFSPPSCLVISIWHDNFNNNKKRIFSATP